MPKPVCVKCQRFYRPHRNGTYWTEMRPIGPERAPSGTAAPERWQPYKIWLSDLWRCDGCGNEIIVGHASQPIAEHYHDEFADIFVKSHADNILINDC